MGLLVILLMFPLPGYVAKQIQTVQVEKMKKVSRRDHCHRHRAHFGFKDRCPRPDRHREYVYLSFGSRDPRGLFLPPAAMNVIRMIKLFGWEPRITAQVNEKREEELIAVRRARFLSMSNNLCKWVFSCLIFPRGLSAKPRNCIVISSRS